MGPGGVNAKSNSVAKCGDEHVTRFECDVVTSHHASDDGWRDSDIDESSQPSGGSQDDGGVNLRDPLEMVLGLIGCGLTAGEATKMANNYYAAVRVSHGDELTEGSVPSVTASVRREARTRAWRDEMLSMPEATGQCYLHVIRWGRRNAYLRELKQSPAMSDFVKMLEPRDLDLQAAREYSLFRLLTTDPINVFYHIAKEYPAGVRVGSVYDCVAHLLATYPSLNAGGIQLPPDNVLERMPIVGTVGVVGEQLPGVFDAVAGIGPFDHLQGNGDDNPIGVTMSCQSLVQLVRERRETVLFLPANVTPVDDSRRDLCCDGALTLMGEWCYPEYSLLYCDSGIGCITTAECAIELEKRPTMLIVPPCTWVRSYALLSGEHIPDLHRSVLSVPLYNQICEVMHVHKSTLHAFMRTGVGRHAEDKLVEPIRSEVELEGQIGYCLPCSGSVDYDLHAGGLTMAGSMHLYADAHAPSVRFRCTAVGVSTIPYVALWAETDVELTINPLDRLTRVRPVPELEMPSRSSCEHDWQIAHLLSSNRDPGVLDGLSTPVDHMNTCICLRRIPVDSVADGYCYLQLLSPPMRPWVAGFVGPNPSVSVLLRVLLWAGSPSGSLFTLREVDDDCFHVVPVGDGFHYRDAGDRVYAELCELYDFNPRARVGTNVSSVVNADAYLPQQYVKFVTPAFAILIACASMLVTITCLIVRMYCLSSSRR